MSNLSESIFVESSSANKLPRISIGLPVYNGENYLEQSLNCLLNQSFEDFELIISDNGSTDGTEKICRDYCRRDGRIRYERYEQNKGASWNFNHVVDVARGEYFKWAAHDDLISDTFLEESLAILDKNPDIVLCYSGSNIIDENNCVTKKVPISENLNHVEAYQRFAASWRYPPNLIVFGVVRADVMKKTNLLGPYSSSDRVLAAELSLLGRLYGIPSYSFSFRQHPQQSTGINYPTRKGRSAWFDPNTKGERSFPHWRLLREFLFSISESKSELGFIQRAFCYRSIARWCIRYHRSLAWDLVN
jgi:glycosyltransferase involved in cell wall biosynthesis